MKIRLLGTASFFSSLIAFGVWSLADPATKSVEGTGTAPLSSTNPAQSRTDAIDAALEDAVLKTAVRQLSPDFLARNRDVLAARIKGKGRNLVRDFKVRSEEKQNGRIVVKIEAVPHESAIVEHLTQWGLHFDRSRRPRLGLFSLTDGTKTSSAVTSVSRKWTGAVAERLRGFGYSVDPLRSKTDAGDARHDISVWGQIQSRRGDEVQILLQAAQRSPHTELGRTKAVLSMQQGESTAAGVIASMLLENILPSWFVRIGEGRAYEVWVSGLRSGKPYQELLAFLNSGRQGLSSGRETMLSPGLVVFEVLFDGSTTQLGKILVATPLTGTKLSVTDVQNRSIKVQAK